METYNLGANTGTAGYVHKAPKGISSKRVEEITELKQEPDWMRDIRLRALAQFESMPIPSWGADLSEINWHDIHYYLKSVERPYDSWEQVPRAVKQVFEQIGVPVAEQKYLAGVTGQYDSEKIYGSLKQSLAKQGVIFCSMDEGLKDHAALVKQYFGTVVPHGDNKLAALNTAVWSGGSLVYVPKGVKVELPLQAYFRINAERAGQFERTLIVVEEGASVHYVEGCSAPAYSSASLHAAVVEVIVKPGAKVRYTTIQNWYKNVYNLVTKRARVEAGGRMEWVDCNLGSKVTMKYPSCILAGEGASGEMLSIAVAGSGQQLDAGAKMIHLAPKTTSRIISKSISQHGGRSSYRGRVVITPKAIGAKSKVVCDALIMDELSRSDTYPDNQVMTGEATIEHEAYVSRIGEEQILYLESRGLTRAEAETMIIRGFLDPVAAELPMEYAVELNRLVKMEMEGSVG